MKSVHSSEADHHCDVLVVGGGIHGVAVARDLAGRGWQVMLCEQGDLAHHGGWSDLASSSKPRSRPNIAERDRLRRAAPQLWSPQQVVTLQNSATQPVWMRQLRGLLHHVLPLPGLLEAESHRVPLAQSPLGVPLRERNHHALVRQDDWIPDARLVTLCAIDAATRGAHVLTRTRCEQLLVHGQGWLAALAHLHPHTQVVTHRLTVYARALVNASGPWAHQVLNEVVVTAPALASGDNAAPLPAQPEARTVKCTHIVVPRLLSSEHTYVFKGADQRIVYAMPYEGRYTLIGATGVVHPGKPDAVQVSPNDVAYLCDALNGFLRTPVYPHNVLHQHASAHSLITGSSKHLHPAPSVTIWGGPLRMWRALAEKAADEIGQLLSGSHAPWTADAALPGTSWDKLLDEAQNPVGDLATFRTQLRRQHPWMDLSLMRRWTTAYGSRVLQLLAGVSSRADLGVEVAPDLYEIELQFLRRHEWVMTADDALWRRSQLGLHYTPAQRDAVEDWFEAQNHDDQFGYHHSAMSRNHSNVG